MAADAPAPSPGGANDVGPAGVALDLSPGVAMLEYLDPAEENSVAELQLLGAVVNPPVALTLLIANKLWDPIADYIGYPCDRKRRIDDHKQAVQRVIAMRDDFLLIGPCPPSLQSRHWLKCVKQLEEEYTKIQLSYLKGGYLNTCSCAREAMKETKRAEDLASQFKELTIDTKARSLPVKGSKRKEDASLVINSYKDLVIKFINDTSGEARMLGIWGMAGIGKSTLLRQVSKCRSEFLPDADDLLLLLFVDIGLDCSIDKVQKSLLGLLGITVQPDVTEAGVALAICNRLLGMRFLIMFDGLSSPINLSRVGIPDPPPVDLLPLIARCQKVVFTTQKESVCASMGCNKTIQMICPSAIDAEKLFNHAVGENIMKDQRISSLAPMIINECGRLPEALWKVGRSLSIKDTPEEWEVALKLMRQSKLSMVTYQSDDLIDRLRRNYNDLEENMKECFLVCSLWCQEEDIAIKDLVQLWRAMDLLDTFNGHAEGYAYVRMLQQLALLERGENSVTSSEVSHVRMNAMMHKVAKQILRDRGVTWAPNSPWRPALTEHSWLQVQNVWVSEKDMEILSRKKFLIKKLLSNVNVLIARCDITFEHCQFEGLMFLDLKGVKLLKIPSAIWKMLKLQYLNLSSTRISAIPLDMKKLSNLKYLCLRDNLELVDLPKGLIGKFYKLKELDIFATGCLLNSFLIRELQEADLGYLMLGLTVKARDTLMLLRSECPRISAIYICLCDLNGYTIYLDMLSDCKKLRELKIVNCDATSLVVENTRQRLPSLQLVTIRQLPNLKEVDFHTMGVNITSLSICDCPMVIDLTWIKGLINLEQLSVSDCRMVKKILSLDVANQETISLPKLKTIHLERLRELLVISDVTLKLESIVHVSVFLCGKLVGLLPVDKDKPKVLLDCDEIFSQTVLQDGNRSSYIMRVA